MGTRIVPVFVLLLGLVFAQENAQTRIPRSLLECYEEPHLLQRDNRLPMTVGSLIDLVRKVENSPGNNMDIRTLTVAILHRFRLDGIVRDSSLAASSNIIPYSPKGFQFHKHKIVLSNFIPGNSLNFPNNSLTPIERCSFHSMVSHSIEENVRGDEGFVCNSLARYRAQRLPRDISDDVDVEVLDDNAISNMNNKGNYKFSDDGDNFGKDDVDFNVPRAVDSSDSTKSQCPVETGTVSTLWGTVSAGTVLSGIAAGLQFINVPLGEISTNMESDRTKLSIDNRYAVTLAGDLAEASLLQGPKTESQKEPISIGSRGVWNDTKVPKWHFLAQSIDNEMTDAEIRGGMDGIILGLNIEQFRKKFDKIKLSQLLDMYYSQRGVFSNNKFRACNRQGALSEFAPTAKLTSETLSCTYVLDKPMLHSATISDKGFIQYSGLAVQSLNSYIPKLNDLACSVIDNSDLSHDVEASTNIYLIVDFNWQFHEIYPNLGYLLENLDISPFNSNVTLINARTGNVIVNTTSHLSVFHEFYNVSIHLNQATGISFADVFETIRQLQTNTLEREKSTGWGGGTSSIALFIASSNTNVNEDATFLDEQIRIFREIMPDLTFLFLAAGSRDRFKNLVRQPERDILPLTAASTQSSASELNEMVKRIKGVPRRIINPRCGASWPSIEFASTTINQYVAPSMINYYRIHPNYFFKTQSGSMVKIQGFNQGGLSVCYSRNNELPRQKDSTTSNGDSVCEAVTGNRVEINLADICTDSTLIQQCAPFYISVEGVAVQESNPRCIERGCRYPDGIKYSIEIQTGGCYSSAARSILNVSVLILGIFVNVKYFFNA